MKATKHLITVKSYTKKELIHILGIPSIKVLNTKIAPYSKLIGKKVGKYYDCWQVELMIALFGMSKDLDAETVDSVEKRNSTMQKLIDKFERNENKKREP